MWIKNYAQVRMTVTTRGQDQENLVVTLNANSSYTVTNLGLLCVYCV